ncbi:tape measure protein [Elizabethkingia meningoseptica]|uniref:tape measure protein n=2 Tax=Elizabethkingia meningoseptica TaxID=238 RepID=UPI001625CCDC|nr:tape measure protein [Elizabethkingia meningoseptica]MBG0512952.1 tape measure protein [Elizabethkingia meningoseptica]MBG0515219.1 tape measure protein [Elizabethkingia meningoseptica]
MNQGALHFETLLTTRDFEAGMQRIRNDIKGTSNIAQQEAQKMDTAFKNLSLGIAGYFSAQSLMGFAKKLIDVRGEFQKTEIAFTTMLGNAGKAKVLMGEMVNLAAKTPFGLKEVADGAKQLLAFQVPANQVVDTLTRMGNIAAGLGVPLSRINLVYGQVKAKGRLMGDDLRQFTEAGIPMVAELADKFGKTEAEIIAMVSAGKIGFKDVEAVLKGLTDEGGMFFNLMEKQSESLSGKWSNLEDSFEQMLNKIGASNQGILGGGIDQLSEWVENYQEVARSILELVSVYGTYKAAVIVTDALAKVYNRTIMSEIALLGISEKMKLGRLLVTQRQAVAAAEEAAAELANARAKYASLQAEVSSLAIKKQAAVQSGILATVRAQEARVQLALAEAELASIQATGTAREIEIAQKEVSIAQNKVIATQETAAIARKRALAAGTEFHTAKQNLENAATAVGTAEKTAATTAEVAQAAAKEANSYATTKLTFLQNIQTLSTLALAKAQEFLNATLMSNPYATVIVLLGVLTYSIYKAASATSELQKVLDQYNEDLKQTNVSVNEQKTKLEALIKNIKKQSTSYEEASKLLKQVNKLTDNRIDGLTVEAIKTGKADAAIKAYTQSLYRNAEAMLKVQEIAKWEEELKTLKEDVKDFTFGEKLNQSFNPFSANYWTLNPESDKKEKIKALEKVIADAKKDVEKAVKDGLDLNTGNTTEKAAAKLGYVEQIQEQIDMLTEAYKKAPSPAAAAKILRERAILQKKLDDLEPKKEKKENRQIAEILPVGSIAELQRRAKLIEDAANVAVNGIVKLRKVDKYGAEKDKKGNVYYTGETVTVEEAKKRVEAINRAIREKQAESQARTFSEEMDEIKRQIGIRDKLLQQGYTKESIDKMFPKIKDKSFLQYLEETDIAVKKLIESGEADKETIQNLDLIKNSIKEYKGLETYIEGVNNQIDVLKTKFSGSELISQLDKYKKLNAGDSTEDERASRDKAVKKAQEDERKRVEANYNQLLNDHKTFEEKKAKITRDLNDALGLAKNDSEKEKIRKAYNEQFSAITVEAFRNSKDWQIAFSELEFVTKSALERILQKLIAFRQANKENLSIQDYKIVSDKINEIQNKLNVSNPLASIIQGYKDYRKASDDVKKRQEELNQANLDLAESYQLLNKAQSGEEFDAAEQKRIDALKRRAKATEDVQKAEADLSEKQRRLLDSLDSVSKYFNDVRSIISSVKGIFDDLGLSMDNAFGDVLANLEQTMQGFEQFQKGLTNAIQGFASGNIVQGIAGGIQAIGGLIKSISGWFNNDKKKERQIKSWANEVENLKNMYKELEYAVRKALGDDIYKGQLDQVKNLQQQQQLLIQMRNKEADKKKSDQGKINDYNSQIEDINRAIQDIRDNIIKTVLQTDAKDLAAQLGDAFIEAFSKGEDAAKALDKVAGDVFRNMVKNALKMRMEKALQPVLDQILKASGFDEKGNGSFKGFTPEQIEQYKKQIAQIGASQEEFLKAYQQLFQDANSNVSGMEGSIKSITSEEAGALIAQINAMRINQGKTINIHQENLELMRGVLMQLMKIEDNTRNLHQMRKDLSELNSKVSKDNGLRPAGL